MVTPTIRVKSPIEAKRGSVIEIMILISHTMGPTLGQMEKNILEGGRKGSNMEKGHFFSQMELRSQESPEKTSHGK